MLARKSLLVFATHLLNSLVGLASTFVVARLMGPEVLGAVGYLLGLVAVVAAFSDLGLSVVHAKRASERDDIAESIGAMVVLKGGLTLVVMLVLYLWPVVSRWLGQEPLGTREHVVAYYILASMFLFRAVGTVLTSTFRARQEMAKISSALLASSLATALAKIGVALAGLSSRLPEGLGLVALSGCYLLEDVVLAGVALFHFRGYAVRRPRRADLRRYVAFTLPVMLTFVVGNLTANGDRVLLGGFWSDAEVGYYLAVGGIIRIMEQVSAAAMSLFLPQSSRDAHHGRHRLVAERLFAAEKYLLLIMLPIAVLVVYFREPIVVLLLSRRFLRSVPVLAVLAVSVVFKTFSAPYRNLAYALEKPLYLAWTGMVGLVTLLVADLVLIPDTLFGLSMAGLGSLGAALGWLIMSVVEGSVLVLLLNRPQSRRPRPATASPSGTFGRAGLPIYWEGLWFLGAGGLMYSALHLLGSVLGWSQPWQIPLLVLIGGCVYMGCLFLARRIRWSDLAFLLQAADPRKMLGYVSSELGSRDAGKATGPRNFPRTGQR